MNDPSQDTTSSASSPDSAKPARLVVETHHQDLLLATLRDLDLTGEVSDDSAELRLTRLKVIRQDTEVPEVDGLLLELRRRISARFGGWVPALGKDREAPAAAMGRGGSRIPMGLGIHPFGGSRIPMAHSFHPHAGAGHPSGVHLIPTGGSRIPMSHHPGVAMADARRAGSPVRIGLIDVRTPESLDTDPPPITRAGHSVFVRDLIHQVAPDAEVCFRGVLSPADEENTTWDVVTAMVELALDEDVDILLMRLGGFTTDGQAPLLFTRAVARIRDHTMIIAAAGNHVVEPGWLGGYGASSPAWPAALPDVIAVGGAELPASGEQLPWVDAVTSVSTFTAAFLTGTLLRPDGQPVTFDGRARATGTSFCAAYAAGAVAARMSGGLSPGEAWDALFEEAAAAGLAAEPSS